MKLLSINLWYDNYMNKTHAQLSSFRQFGYMTDVATIVHTNGQYIVRIFSVTDIEKNLKTEQSFNSWYSAFRFLFNNAKYQEYDLIYIRRLMSKLLYAASSIRRTGKKIPIVYEIPTFPLDTNETILYKIRDSLEMMIFSSLKSSIALTAVILRQDITLPEKWISFHNGIDISGYSITPIPELNREIRFIIVANIAEWHRYDRMLHAMKAYKGKYVLRLTVITPVNDTVDSLKKLANELGIASSVDFVGKKNLSEIRKYAQNSHIGVGQLSWSTDCSPQINTLKTKDYCAMGLPFILSCRDTSFGADYPYAYVLENMDDEIDLNDVIKWYTNIHANPAYRQEMYDYAKDNLQFHELVSRINAELGIN